MKAQKVTFQNTDGQELVGWLELPADQLPQNTQQVSDEIFSTYIVPFEALSVLLLAALIGAVVVARRD